jgi:oligopeptide/dipeptide ABC transporter ATP-binding protein
MNVRRIIVEPLRKWDSNRDRNLDVEARQLAERVHLDTSLLDAFPHQLTGGQQQRVAIARAIATNPDFIVLDEPTSYLGPVETKELLALLLELQRKYNLSYLFISHDLSTVRSLSHHVAVMYLGQVMEFGTTEEIFSAPKHPYTQALLSCLLNPDPKQRGSVKLLTGEIPSPVNLPSGCFFHTRCPHAIEGCTTSDQELVQTSVTRQVACWRVTDPTAPPIHQEQTEESYYSAITK